MKSQTFQNRVLSWLRVEVRDVAGEDVRKSESIKSTWSVAAGFEGGKRYEPRNAAAFRSQEQPLADSRDMTSVPQLC